jgi:hypothetical protein
MFGALGLGRKPETFQLRLGYALTTEHAARVAAEALPPTPAAPLTPTTPTRRSIHADAGTTPPPSPGRLARQATSRLSLVRARLSRSGLTPCARPCLQNPRRFGRPHALHGRAVGTSHDASTTC